MQVPEPPLQGPGSYELIGCRIPDRSGSKLRSTAVSPERETPLATLALVASTPR